MFQVSGGCSHFTTLIVPPFQSRDSKVRNNNNTIAPIAKDRFNITQSQLFSQSRKLSLRSQILCLSFQLWNRKLSSQKPVVSTKHPYSYLGAPELASPNVSWGIRRSAGPPTSPEGTCWLSGPHDMHLKWLENNIPGLPLRPTTCPLTDCD